MDQPSAQAAAMDGVVPHIMEQIAAAATYRHWATSRPSSSHCTPQLGTIRKTRNLRRSPPGLPGKSRLLFWSYILSGHL